MALDSLADGFASICIDPNLNYFADGCHLVLEGQYVVNGALAQPIVPDKLMSVPAVRNVDAWFGAGSPLAEALKIAFCTCPVGVRISVIPRLSAGGAVASVYTMTVAGPATTDGVVDLFLGDSKYSAIGVEVEAGDTATVIAAAIAAAIPAAFPYTVTVVAGVITATSKVGGTIGNYLNPVYNYKGLSNHAPAGVTLTVVRTVTGATDPAPLNYQNIFGDCCVDCYALLSGNSVWQQGVRDYIRSAWDCTKPQCFGHGYTFNAGTLGQVLAAGDNSAEWTRTPYPVNDVNFPWAIVANDAALSCCTGCSSPELSIQGPQYGRLACIDRPSTCTTPWSYDEMVQLKEAGFAVYGPLSNGSGVLTNPYVHNDVTNYLYDEMGRQNLTFRDTSSRRRAKVNADKIATMLREYSGLSLFSTSTRVAAGVYGTTKRMIEARIKAWAKSQVGILWSQFDNLDKDIVLRSDGEVQRACFGKPCDFHLNIRYRDQCRINHFNVNLQPLVFDNCDRR